MAEGGSSGAPSVIGDAHDDQWRGIFLADIYGRPVWEGLRYERV